MFSTQHREVDPAQQKYAVINSKGFGGNNASATLMSPACNPADVAGPLLRTRSGGKWEQANESVRERQQAYDDGMIAGKISPVYKFDHGVFDDSDVEVGPAAADDRSACCAAGLYVSL